MGSRREKIFQGKATVSIQVEMYEIKCQAAMQEEECRNQVRGVSKDQVLILSYKQWEATKKSDMARVAIQLDYSGGSLENKSEGKDYR